MSEYQDPDEEEQESENEEDGPGLTSPETYFRDGVVILVDAHERMFIKDEDGREPFFKTLELLTAFVKAKIVAEAKDLLALVFFNTAVSKNDHALAGVHVARALDEPDAAMLKQLQSLEDRATFKKQIGSGKCDFSHALFVCSGVLSKEAPKNMFKRIFIFTNNDDPTFGNEAVRANAMQKQKDLNDLEIDCDVFPLTGKFDVRTFYMHLVSIDVDEDQGKIAQRFSSKLEDIAERFKKKQFKKRSLATVPFQISPDVHIGIKLYVTVRESKPPYPVQVDQKTGRPVQCVTKSMCADTGAVLDEHQIKTYFPYGGERVFFTKDDMNQIKDFGPPGMTLMGFKSRSKLKHYHNIKNSYFVFPDDNSIKGSITAFLALLTQMSKMDKIAIARLVYRKRSIPRFVALLPQEETRDAEGFVATPAGFHLIFLPFCDDIRNPQFDPAPIASPELIVKAKEMVSKLKISLQPGAYHNPRLQCYYNVVEALALDQDPPEDLPDDLIPDVDGMDKAADAIESFNEAVLGAPMEIDESAAKAPKRKAPAAKSAGRAAPAAKRVKREAGADDGAPAGRDFRSMCQDGTLKKCTVPELKDFLKSVKQPVSGKKDDLMDRVQAYFARG